MIGQVLGNYRVISRLGAGGMGTIWLAEHQLLGSRAAIKVLLPEMSAQRRIVQRFFDEARAATKVKDPSIVTVLDFGWHEGSAYLVMEYLVGETLADRLRRVDRMPLVQAVRITQQCGIAMAAAHAAGIVHRDLKPDNIFLIADAAVAGGERIKILDFGIAKLIDNEAHHSRTQTGVIMGTPAFMSPEQCRGVTNVDHRTDIYALGCVLFNMVCGRPPFIAGMAGDLLVAHMRDSPPVPSSLVPGLPRDLDAVILRCLAKDPADRFETMTELVRAGAFLTGDNMHIDTIAPMRASQARDSQPSAPRPTPNPAVAETKVSGVSVPLTTLGGSTGESIVRTRPWRGGLIIAASVLVGAGVITFVMTRTPASAVVIDAASNAATTTPDAAVDATRPTDAQVIESPAIRADVIDAGAPTPPRTPARTSTGRRPGAPAHGTSGSATSRPPAGSGADGKSYDPYDDR